MVFAQATQIPVCDTLDESGREKRILDKGWLKESERIYNDQQDIVNKVSKKG